MVESWHGWQEARLDAGPDGATLARVVIGDTAKVIDGELGSFLRARREAVRPVDVGLPEGPRRRTPGLRRAELATQAGISVEYLTRIEQGRDRRPSIQVLAALARVLRLGDDDLRHLQQLAVISGGTELLCQQAREAGRPVLRPTVRALLERLEPTPAYVVDHRLDLLAWTDGYERVARPCGLLDRDPPNLAWFTFADDRARAAFPDWAVMADEQVAALHELRRGDLEVDQLADRLTEVAGAESAIVGRACPSAHHRRGPGPWPIPSKGSCGCRSRPCGFPTTAPAPHSGSWSSCPPTSRPRPLSIGWPADAPADCGRRVP